MKVEIDIPDFVPPEMMIHIIAGNYERIGYIEPHTRRVFVKTGRCSRCGDCCRKIECSSLIFKNGFWSCGKDDMPVICVIGHGKGIDHCTVKYSEQK